MGRLTMATIALLWLAVATACGDRPPTSPTPTSPGTLRGIVANEAGVRLSALVSIADGSGRGRITTADGNGEYRFEDVASGDVTMRAWMKGYQDVERRVVVAGTTTLNFTLSLLPKGVLSGVITDVDSGASIAGASVLVLPDPTTDVSGTLDFALRRRPTPETFTGQVGWSPLPACVHQVPGAFAYPCVAYPFTMRRRGAIDVVITWRGGSQTTIGVQVLSPSGLVAGDPQPVRSSDGTSHRLAFSLSTFSTGTHTLRIIDLDNYRLGAEPRSTGAIPFTLALTRDD